MSAPHRAPHQTFTNGIRKVPGVDVYKINEGGQLIVTCINGVRVLQSVNSASKRNTR